MAAPPPSFCVAQIGARRHYAVPRALERAGRLAALYTDICGTSGWPSALNAIPSGLQPDALRRLLERRPEGIAPAKIHSFPTFALQYAARLRQAQSEADRYDAFLWGARRFNELVLEAGFGAAGGVYAFNSAGLEILGAARERGLATCLDQTIAPLQTERDLLAAEHARFPGWADPPEANPHHDAYMERNRQEWAAAGRIICGSDFVRNAVAACGGPAGRCRVVPYGYDPEWEPQPRAEHSGPLRVLYAGAVGLRKGAPYVLEAARRLKGRAEFHLAGPVQVKEQAARDLAAHARLLGAVPRDEMRVRYQWADVFLLPSLCEGSATVTYEALAAGVPVVCTPNAGSVVRDGQDGYIVSIRDVDAIVERLERLAADTELRRTLGASGMQRVAEFTVARYGDRLQAVIDNSQEHSE